MSTSITDEERRILRHAVGADAKPKQRGYRNRYMAPTDSAAERAWRGLVERGLARAGESESGCTWFCATPAVSLVLALCVAAVGAALRLLSLVGVSS